MAEKLKRCPFCGGEAEFYAITNSVDKSFGVECSECECSTKLCTSKNEAIEFWNRRVDNA